VDFIHLFHASVNEAGSLWKTKNVNSHVCLHEFQIIRSYWISTPTNLTPITVHSYISSIIYLLNYYILTAAHPLNLPCRSRKKQEKEYPVQVLVPVRYHCELCHNGVLGTIS
jgi:hypothetical protein